jgi:hypothetical protein
VVQGAKKQKQKPMLGPPIVILASLTQKQGEPLSKPQQPPSKDMNAKTKSTMKTADEGTRRKER